jgi:sterol desaturase/sphingolipid hydroxylase (fatty acid hydroxylase superfamily)
MAYSYSFRKVMKKKIIILSLFVITVLIFGIYYYWDKLFLILNDKDRFFELFLNASQLSKFSVKFFILSISISFVAFLTESIAVGWEKSALYRLRHSISKTFWIDIWSYVLSVFMLFEFFTFVFTFGVFYLLISVINKFFFLNLGSFIVNPYIQFVFIFILSDFINYWRHRFNHFGPFWELHSLHHSATEFNLITTTRGSFWEAGFNSVFFSFVYILGGEIIEPILAVMLLREFHLLLSHSNVKWNYGWFGKFVFLTPLDHKLHHSVKIEDFNKNLGSVFNWWDKLFGTYKKNKDSEILIGIEGSKIQELNFFYAQYYVSKEFLKRILQYKKD